MSRRVIGALSVLPVLAALAAAPAIADPSAVALAWVSPSLSGATDGVVTKTSGAVTTSIVAISFNDLDPSAYADWEEHGALKDSD